MFGNKVGEGEEEAQPQMSQILADEERDEDFERKTLRFRSANLVDRAFVL